MSSPMEPVIEKNPLQKDKCTRPMGNPMAKLPDENCHKQKHIEQAQHLTQLS